jgi:hypothetical protein
MSQLQVETGRDWDSKQPAASACWLAVPPRWTPRAATAPESPCALAAGAANQTQILGDFYRLDPLTLRWTLLGAGSPPPARYGHGLASVAGAVYVFGGFKASGEAERARWLF